MLSLYYILSQVARGMAADRNAEREKKTVRIRQMKISAELARRESARAVARASKADIAYRALYRQALLHLLYFIFYTAHSTARRCCMFACVRLASYSTAYRALYRQASAISRASVHVYLVPHTHKLLYYSFLHLFLRTCTYTYIYTHQYQHESAYAHVHEQLNIHVAHVCILYL